MRVAPEGLFRTRHPHKCEKPKYHSVFSHHLNAGGEARNVCFYRDARKREIDIVIQDGRTLHPVEVKAGALIKPDAVRNFACLEGFEGYEVGFGHVVCQTREPYLLAKNVQAVPVWAI